MTARLTWLLVALATFLATPSYAYTDQGGFGVGLENRVRANFSEPGPSSSDFRLQLGGMLQTTELASTVNASGVGLLFQAHLYDYETGLYLMRARVYDPRTGSFLQRDPEGFVDSVNPYAGMRWDPINKRDPTGRKTADGCVSQNLGTPEECESQYESGRVEDWWTYRARMSVGRMWAKISSYFSPEALVDEFENQTVRRVAGDRWPPAGAEDVIFDEKRNFAEDIAKVETASGYASGGAAAAHLATEGVKYGVRKTISKSRKLLPSPRSATVMRKGAGRAFGSSLPRVKGRWLRGSHGNSGYIPQRIAKRLSGRDFTSFDDFRGAFWREVSDDTQLASQFSRANRTRMGQGLAPIAHTSQHYGAQRSYILHHRKAIEDGGAVFDMSNIRIVTPRLHQATHYGR